MFEKKKWNTLVIAGMDFLKKEKSCWNTESPPYLAKSILLDWKYHDACQRERKREKRKNFSSTWSLGKERPTH